MVRAKDSLAALATDASASIAAAGRRASEEGHCRELGDNARSVELVQPNAAKPATHPSVIQSEEVMDG